MSNDKRPIFDRHKGLDREALLALPNPSQALNEVMKVTVAQGLPEKFGNMFGDVASKEDWRIIREFSRDFSRFLSQGFSTVGYTQADAMAMFVYENVGLGMAAGGGVNAIYGRLAKKEVASEKLDTLLNFAAPAWLMGEVDVDQVHGALFAGELAAGGQVPDVSVLAQTYFGDGKQRDGKPPRWCMYDLLTNLYDQKQGESHLLPWEYNLVAAALVSRLLKENEQMALGPRLTELMVPSLAKLLETALLTFPENSEKARRQVAPRAYIPTKDKRGFRDFVAEVLTDVSVQTVQVLGQESEADPRREIGLVLAEVLYGVDSAYAVLVSQRAFWEHTKGNSVYLPAWYEGVGSKEDGGGKLWADIRDMTLGLLEAYGALELVAGEVEEKLVVDESLKLLQLAAQVESLLVGHQHMSEVLGFAVLGTDIGWCAPVEKIRVVFDGRKVLGVMLYYPQFTAEVELPLPKQVDFPVWMGVNMELLHNGRITDDSEDAGVVRKILTIARMVLAAELMQEYQAISQAEAVAKVVPVAAVELEQKVSEVAKPSLRLDEQVKVQEVDELEQWKQAALKAAGKLAVPEKILNKMAEELDHVAKTSRSINAFSAIEVNDEYEWAREVRFGPYRLRYGKRWDNEKLDIIRIISVQGK